MSSPGTVLYEHVDCARREVLVLHADLAAHMDYHAVLDATIRCPACGARAAGRATAPGRTTRLCLRCAP